MLSENMHAALTGDHDGCDDPSHFSRDYKGHFGKPPARGMERLREHAHSH